LETVVVRVAENEVNNVMKCERDVLSQGTEMMFSDSIKQSSSSEAYSSGHHHTAHLKATEGLQTPSPPRLFRAAVSQQYSVARFAALQVMICLHSRLRSAVRVAALHNFAVALQGQRELSSTTPRFHV
jgi:hypothetical protein